MKLRVLIKEVLVVCNWLTFHIIYIYNIYIYIQYIHTILNLKIHIYIYNIYIYIYIYLYLYLYIYFDSILKVGLSGIQTHDLWITMYPLSYMVKLWDMLNGLQY